MKKITIYFSCLVLSVLMANVTYAQDNGYTYKDQEVTGFWESTDPSKKGYYLEVRDNNGKASKVWANDKGEMSNAFPKGNSGDQSPN